MVIKNCHLEWDEQRDVRASKVVKLATRARDVLQKLAELPVLDDVARMSVALECVDRMDEIIKRYSATPRDTSRM